MTEPREPPDDAILRALYRAVHGRARRAKSEDEIREKVDCTDDQFIESLARLERDAFVICDIPDGSISLTDAGRLVCFDRGYPKA